eukprot:scaffold499_cov129-Isochrysis_galbana.AAC.5
MPAEGEQPRVAHAAAATSSAAPSAAAPPSSPVVDAADLRRKLAAAEARVLQLESSLVGSQAELGSAAETLQEFRTKHTAVLESSSKQLTDLRAAFRKERQHNLLYEKILASQKAELDGLQQGRGAAGAESVAAAVNGTDPPTELVEAAADPACADVRGGGPGAGDSAAAGDGSLATTSTSGVNGLPATSASAVVSVQASARRRGGEQAPSEDATSAGSRSVPTTDAPLTSPNGSGFASGTGLDFPGGAGACDASALTSEVRRLRVEARSLRREARRGRRAEMLLRGVVVSEAVRDRTQSLLRWTACSKLVPRGVRLSRDRERLIISHAPGESSLLGDTRLELHRLRVEFGVSHPGMQRLFGAFWPAPPQPWLVFSLVEEEGGRAFHFVCDSEGAALAIALALGEQVAARRAELGWGDGGNATQAAEEVEEVSRAVALDGLAVEEAGAPRTVLPVPALQYAGQYSTK